MLMVQCSLNVVDSSIRHATSFKNIQPLLSSLFLCKVLDQSIDICSVLDTVTIGDKASISLPLGKSKSVAENAEQLVIPTPKQNVPVKRFVAAIGYNRC